MQVRDDIYSVVKRNPHETKNVAERPIAEYTCEVEEWHVDETGQTVDNAMRDDYFVKEVWTRD